MNFSGWQWMRNPVAAIITASLLFGIATPVLKILLVAVKPVLLVALLSAGAGGGILCWLLINRQALAFPTLQGSDRYRLLGTVVIGGLVAPLVQFISLSATPAATASLLLNFEIVSTVFFAYLLFHEPLDRKIMVALVAVLCGSILLSWNGSGSFDFSVGACGIILSCLLWGLDNNLMGRIAGLSPELIVVVKALSGGSIALLLVLLLNDPFPAGEIIVVALTVGFLSLGVGLVLLISALRAMGAARAGVVYATAPFIGCITSLILFVDPLADQFWWAFPLFVIGAVIIVKEQWRRKEKTGGNPSQ
jgi:drug/metabolite transporter (DMT)-like permease